MDREQLTTVEGLGGLKYVVDALSQWSNFLKLKCDVVVFGGFGDSTGESILNSLVAVYLGDIYVEEERIAVV